ncbi:MAG: glycosyl hydrolase 53 family protein [Candidatus Kryptoniota bacterium]
MFHNICGVLDTLKLAGVVPKWVQIGNETNNGMMWPLRKGTTHMSNFAQMIDTGYQSAGRHDLVWMANNFPGGVYFCRLTSENFQSIRKVILLK